MTLRRVGCLSRRWCDIPAVRGCRSVQKSNKESCTNVEAATASDVVEPVRPFAFPRPSGPATDPAKRRRSALESLEDRTVLSSISAPTTASLYAAITAANAATGPATVNIQLSPTTYAVSSGELDITATGHQVIIHGNGAVLDAGGANRVIETGPGTNVTLQDLEVKDGKAGPTAPTLASAGGGILNAGSLSLNNVLLDHDTVLGGGGSNSTVIGTSASDSVSGRIAFVSAFGGPGGTGGTGGNGLGGGLYSSGGWSRS